MTPKEKRQKELEKLSSMNTRQKLEYIWAYYKSWIFGALAVVILVGIGISFYQHSRIQTVLGVSLVNITKVDSDQLEKDFKAYIGDEDPYHEVTIGVNVFANEDGSMNNANLQANIVAEAQAQAMDVFLCPEGVYDSLKGDEVLFVSPEEYFTEQELASLGDMVLEEGIHIGENTILEQYATLLEEDLYLLITDSSRNKENVLKFIEFLRK